MDTDERSIRTWASRLIYRSSPRCDRPFVVLNCAALLEDLPKNSFGHQACKGSLLTNTPGRNCLSANVFVIEVARGVLGRVVLIGHVANHRRAR
jgi:hypothetical protein